MRTFGHAIRGKIHSSARWNSSVSIFDTLARLATPEGRMMLTKMHDEGILYTPSILLAPKTLAVFHQVT